jgi:hypothetical protein
MRGWPALLHDLMIEVETPLGHLQCSKEDPRKLIDAMLGCASEVQTSVAEALIVYGQPGSSASFSIAETLCFPTLQVEGR